MAASVVCHFNYTNRLTIDKGSIALRTLRPPQGCPIVRIDKLDLPSNGADTHGAGVWNAATVVIEAWRIRTNSFFRKEIGTVADVSHKAPPIFEDHLEEFDDEHQIAFRIKVVSAEKALLAQADGVRSVHEIVTGKDELIQVFPADIGEEVWRVDWSEPDSGPRVLVNRNLPDPADFLLRDPTMTALVLPSIVRDVLYEIARDYSRYAQLDWCRQWLDFIVRFFDRPLEAEMESEEIHSWVGEAVAAFAAAHKLCSGLITMLNETRRDDE